MATTKILMHFVIAPGPAITHFMHDHSQSVPLSIEPANLYLVTVKETSPNGAKVLGGFFVVTDSSHHDAEFGAILASVREACPELAGIMTEGRRLAPARLGLTGSEPITEIEMLRLVLEQYVKHDSGGNA